MSSQGEDVCTTITAGKLLRQRIEAGGFILAPGVHDGFSVRIALEVGFDVLYMTGAGVTASVHGCADLGIATLNDMRRSAEMIASLSPFTPVIADADTGYGGPIMGAHQVQTKRCGHLAGKVLVDLKEYLARIRAAMQARRRIGSDIVIIARTDSIQKHGYEEALARLRAARDAGADAAFPEGLRSVEEARRMIADLAPWPVLLNMVENSVTPKISAKEAKGLGFSMMIVPLATLAPAYTAIKAGLQKLKETGLADTELTPQDLFRVCGLDESMKINEEAGASNFEGGVD
ncbi:related to carboxyphosphonoenolpyruvate phosphonomutase [Fusarium oxysporum]|uniref:Related to carboxyphosphonoenolpyruvate phosphonomutase n=1 Tax=Fusarium oxysporum TaxID=5507 RepID=A0A2H3T9N2_FUSOX|nr:related to carboxyphosphonoenolpyruvate phosphonomutase [Fusarium oxysporum]